MIDTIEELSAAKKIYVLDTNVWRKEKIDYAIYTVSRFERKGVNRYFIELKTNAFKSKFPKRLRAQGFTISFGKYSYQCYDNLDEAIRDYCRILKKDPSKNEELFKKLLELYPQNYV